MTPSELMMKMVTMIKYNTNFLQNEFGPTKRRVKLATEALPVAKRKMPHGWEIQVHFSAEIVCSGER
jgi:hypothetical protein